MQFVVAENSLLIEVLAQAETGSSMNTIRSWLKQGRVSVEGQVVKIGKTAVKKGQTIAVGARQRYLDDEVRILYEDRHLIVIDKPEGLLSVSTAFESSNTVHAILKNKYRPKKVFVVHRLDQDTSGTMVFALSQEAFDGVKKAFEKHDIERRYVAIVEGHLDEKKGTWRSYLYEDANYYVHATSDTRKGVLAITHYEVRGTSKKHSLLDITLETGKKNQIRVHSQKAGHPVIGDKKYGATSNPMKRLGLHAYCLSFTHPITKKPMHFESKVPESFSRIVRPSHA